jgi:hypothetical protein
VIKKIIEEKILTIEKKGKERGKEGKKKKRTSRRCTDGLLFESLLL